MTETSSHPTHPPHSTIGDLNSFTSFSRWRKYVNWYQVEHICALCFASDKLYQTISHTVATLGYLTSSGSLLFQYDDFWARLFNMGLMLKLDYAKAEVAQLVFWWYRVLSKPVDLSLFACNNWQYCSTRLKAMQFVHIHTRAHTHTCT